MGSHLHSCAAIVHGMPRRLDHQPAGAPLSDPEADELARAMAAFATPSRLKLLFALIGVERTVEDLARATGLVETVVSQQLRVLRLLRFVAGRREGRHVRYRLFDDHVPVLLVLGAVTVAVVHSVLPDHWVPIAVVGRTQGWTLVRVARVSGLASAGHVLPPPLLGG